ncbi:hypothetical protein H0A66_00035 [Alcaligenaceae bacterium]|nr:hypothetical protein [Alcaligenaceae bacterium]
MQPSAVTGRDIKQILRNITYNNRPTIANDALLYCKQLFNHGIKLDIIVSNPAFAFSVDDAGGIEKSRDRALTLEELTQTGDGIILKITTLENIKNTTNPRVYQGTG